MNKILKSIAVLGIAASGAVWAQLPPVKVYETGPKLEKPMVMTPFVEFSSARKMPDVKFQTLDGAPVDLDEYKGKLLILNIWASWCAPCLREIPELAKLQQKFKDSDIKILGVSVDERPEMLANFLKKFKMDNFETVADPTQESDRVMPLTIVPTNYVIDGDGNLIGYLPGYLPWEDPEVVPFLEKLAKKYAGRGSV